MADDSPFGDGELIDAPRISDAEWSECVKEMDLRAKEDSGCEDKRAEARQPYRNVTKIIISFKNYDGRQQRFQVRAYDLSSSGLGFLHGAYIYGDTPAEIYMQDKSCSLTRISATIVSCVHVKKRIHRVGARFDQPIDLNDFLLSDAA